MVRDFVYAIVYLLVDLLFLKNLENASKYIFFNFLSKHFNSSLCFWSSPVISLEASTENDGFCGVERVFGTERSCCEDDLGYSK